MNVKLHRWLNTSLASILLCVTILGGNFAYGKYRELETEQNHASEMAQIVSDEGFRNCTYRDSKNLRTIGFGHLLKEHENYKCITSQKAMQLLQEDYYEAWDAVERNFPWAEGEVKLVLTNMSYQIGITKLLGFKKTLAFMEAGDYTSAAMEMIDSKWYRETPERSMRLAVRILALQE